MEKAKNLLGRNLKNLRKKRKWNQAQLAEACDLSIKMVQKIESGKTNPSSNTLDAISKAFGEPVAALYVGGPDHESDEMLTDDESELLGRLRTASSNNKRLILDLARGLTPDYMKV